MKIVLTQVLINGVDVTSTLVFYEGEDTFGDIIPDVVLKFTKDINNLIMPTTGQTVLIYRGYITPTDVLRFSGYVEKYEPEGGLVTITANNKLWDLVRHEVTTIYQNTDAFGGKISAIFQDLVTTYGGLNADSSSIQDSGTTYTLTNFICNHTDPMERCAALAGVLNWQFYYRADTDKVYFEPQGNTTNPLVLLVGSGGNVIGIPKWQYDNTEMVNNVTIIGASQNTQVVGNQYCSGPNYQGKIGTTTGFTNSYIQLDYTPQGSVIVYGDTNNPPTTLLVGGVSGSTTAYDYTVDFTNNRILPKTSFPTNNYYIVRYSYLQPIPVNLYNQDSMDAYGLFKKTITYTDIQSVSDAETRGTNYLAQYSVPFTFATLRVKNTSTSNLQAGQKILIIDNINKPNVNGYFLINKCRYRYPADYDEIDIGDKYWRLAQFNTDILNKLKRIDEAQLSNQDILEQVVNVDNYSKAPVKIVPRYFDVYTQTVSGSNVFILGNPQYGVLGTNQLGDAGIGVQTINSRQQYLNSYSENFSDTDFKDAGNTTANWDTTNKQLSFTIGQVAQSSSIDYANGTISSATISYSDSNGLTSPYLSADGGAHWESVINGTPHNFSNTGTDLRWKLTSSGTTIVTNLSIVNYH